MALGLIVFDQLSFSPQSFSQFLGSEEVAYLHCATDSQGNALSLEGTVAHFPLQALKGEETNLSVNHRLRTTCSLFSIAPLLFGFEAASYPSKAKFFYVKPLYLTEPIYILFRQILE